MVSDSCRVLRGTPINIFYSRMAKSRKRSLRHRSRHRSRRRRVKSRRLKGGDYERTTYDCGGGITCAYGEDTIVTYRDPTDKYSVPAFVSKMQRDSMDVQDSYPN
jgi:hypothetical protein